MLADEKIIEAEPLHSIVAIRLGEKPHILVIRYDDGLRHLAEVQQD